MKKHLSSSTYDGYRKLVEHRMVPALGSHMMVDLKRKMIKDWLDSLEVGNKTLSNIQSCLRSAMTEAIDEELIENNPLAGWTYKRKAAPTDDDDVDPFSPEEQLAIIAAASGQAANLVQFALWTGLRTSELVALDGGCGLDSRGGDDHPGDDLGVEGDCGDTEDGSRSTGGKAIGPGLSGTEDAKGSHLPGRQ